ncbi:hypothetical protein ACVW00_001605 [Marmoricola sp. URHA0025 HA25]
MTLTADVGLAARARSAPAVHLVTAAGLAACAGVIHLAVVRDHLAEAPILGTFFLVVGVAQLGLAYLFLRRRTSPLLLVPAIGAHVGLLMLYVVSRTAELPFVPAHDIGHTVKHLPIAGGVGNGIPIFPGSRIEDVGWLDLGCQAVELGLVLVLTGLLPRRIRSRVGTAMLCVGVAALVARFTGLLV